MKNLLKRTGFMFLALVMLRSVVSVGAFTASASSLFTYTVSGGKATITDVADVIKGYVIVPETLGDYPVVKIGKNAFAHCSDMYSITIPEGVTEIGVQAFAECDMLYSVYIPSSVKSIGDSAFISCPALNEITVVKKTPRI